MRGGRAVELQGESLGPESVAVKSDRPDGRGVLRWWVVDRVVQTKASAPRVAATGLRL